MFITLTCAVTLSLWYFHISWVELIPQLGGDCEWDWIERAHKAVSAGVPVLPCGMAKWQLWKKWFCVWISPPSTLPSSSCALGVCTWSQTYTGQHPGSGLSRCLAPSWDLVAGTGESTSAIHCLDGCLPGTSVVLVAPTCPWQRFVSNMWSWRNSGISRERCGIFVPVCLCRLKKVIARCEILSLRHGELCL